MSTQNRQANSLYYRWRFMLVLGALGLVFASLICRAAYIQVFKSESLTAQGDMRSIRTQSSQTQRGSIMDRNGNELAVSVPVQAIYADPKRVVDSQSLSQKRKWQALAEVLEMDLRELQEKVANPQKRFVYLKRQVSPAIGQYIQELKLPGVYLKPESRRFYPAGEVSSHLVGFTDIDDQGQEGIERSYNDWLTGLDGKRQVRQDRLGRTIENLAVLEQEQSAHDLKLSLDQRLQSLAYRELKRAVTQFNAASGSIVVLDIATGEVLAMANSPSFNPNDRRQLQSYRFRNRAVTDGFEPGSTIKPFTVLTALDQGVATTRTVIDNSPGYMVVGGNRVRDGHSYGKMSLTQVIQKSSNIGVSKLALKMGVTPLLDSLYAVGFGNDSGLGLTGESSGLLPQRRRWSDFETATLSFGYGLMVTPLQLARAYAVLGSGGIARPVSLLKLDEPPKGQRVFDATHTEAVLKMMESVTQKGGTATKAAVEGYRVAGKTGTSRKAAAGGYSGDYVSYFAGVAPVSAPKLAIVVMVNDPKGDHYYGGEVAAPVFSKVMGGSLQYLNVIPDGKNAHLVSLADDLREGHDET
jgi:cell division protein FtsI (penicillin-binding protein 3)